MSNEATKLETEDLTAFSQSAGIVAFNEERAGRLRAELKLAELDLDRAKQAQMTVHQKLSQKYSVTNGDQIDLATGVITRQVRPVSEAAPSAPQLLTESA